jgi:hypothetical protein
VKHKNLVAGMGGAGSVLKARALVSSQVVTSYDTYCTSTPEGAELDYKLKRLGLSRTGK